ncbi:MAG: FtsX-like permease family protein [Clostridiaceae bacterium]|nr:FtsX-like permease family protein [Clostridiaceae bacterium]
MNNLFFSIRFAFSAINKNRRLYLPHIFSGCAFTAISYILMTLVSDEYICQIRGGYVIPRIMQMGTAVMVILSAILILYTNSFLMKQRRRDYGIYHVLGMEKRHIGRILFWESMFSAVAAILTGLFAGMLLYKAFSLLLCRIMQADGISGFYYLQYGAIGKTALVYAGLYVIAFLFSRVQLLGMKTVELLSSRSYGEKEPKVKWPVFVIGLLALGAGYYLALSVQSPLQSLVYFFAAALFVMVGTYCLFTAGTILLFKCLKKNKRYYYKINHMTAVSGLLYRMKQNAVGLASICILATGVLIVLSTTVSLYAGIENSLELLYPSDLILSADYTTTDGTEGGAALRSVLKETIEESAGEYGLTISKINTRTVLRYTVVLEEDGAVFPASDEWNDLQGVERCAGLAVITASEYERLTGKKVSLSENQVGYYELTDNATVHLPDTFLLEGTAWTIVSALDEFPVHSATDQAFNTFGIVVRDDTVLKQMYQLQKSAYGDLASDITYELLVDFSNREEKLQSVNDSLQADVERAVEDYVENAENAEGGCNYSVDSKAEGTANLYGLYGSSLFLGFFLGFVFLFATAVIIYYKQVSEGYEDRDRYQIMQKVGMSRAEIQKSITSQILLVFFLPLFVAAVHMAVAFPILTKFLLCFYLTDKKLFLLCTVTNLLVFSGVYVLIYRLTAKTYYKIVR